MKHPFVKQSTRDYYRACREKGMSLFDFIHGYIYARWCYHYISLAGDKTPWWRWLWIPLVVIIDRVHPFRETDAHRSGDPNQTKATWSDAYHGKPLPLNEASKLIRLDRPVNTALPETVLPYTRARDIILNHPEKIILLDCPCRAGMKNPCTPTDVCLIIGDPFASFILEHHPEKSRSITADEALAVVRAEQARGHVTHAFFKDVAGGKLFAICNCCACCCGAMKAHAMGIPMLCSSGYLAQVDQELCTKCGTCAQKCQFKAIGFDKNGAVIREDRCMGCGVCTLSCPKDALSLRLAPEKGEPIRVDDLH
ncbi:4Fe-4S binding protein [Desulfovibrio sp. Huiquan2017]|uniref:4Fe-4S binding protein n=1 Tax=Desulfovibrio sp. Huiquan2017 TaxID=2816861 RepID=UPI001A927788|nr:4Fe-4S binding protein [Desulfovibrio sp. Huiquan2017]